MSAGTAASSGGAAPGSRLRARLVEGPRSLGTRARAERWARFVAAFPEVRSMRIVDLGGTAEMWLGAPVRPAEVVVVNLRHRSSQTPGWLRAVEGDACGVSRRRLGGQFDLVFSNSLIEHVGGHARRSELADTIHALATRHWVQTPYRYFPIEPHWLFPAFQFLPVRARAAVATRWPLVHTRPLDRRDALRSVLATELVDATQMSVYFPDSTIVRERLGPFTKSLVAVRGATGLAR